MQIFSAIAAIAICATVAISCSYIKERDPRLEGPPQRKNPGLIAFFRQYYEAILRMPPQIRRICQAQFFNWLGWFGFLFYQTTYIGQLYCNPFFAANPDLPSDEVDKRWAEGTLVATYALFIFALTSLACNIFLPFFVIPTYEAPQLKDTAHAEAGLTHADLASSITSLISRRKLRPLQHRFTHLLSRLHIPGLTLRRTWLLAHFIFALCMISTFFITSVTAATIQTAVIGFPWAVTMWAPWALISNEISKRDTEARHRPRDQLQEETHDQAGVVLGLQNVAVSAPQILATLVGSAIFKAVQKPRGKPFDDSTGWVMRFGALAAIFAAFSTWRIFEEWQLNDGKKKAGRYELVDSGEDSRSSQHT